MTTGDGVDNEPDRIEGDDPTRSTVDEARARAPDLGVPERLGPYHIRRRIASGGMGTVYEAMQQRPRRVVALKVMRRGVTSRSALRRFDYEAQILARLRHPNIAQVYEAGVHDDGEAPVPFFAMEYIPGARTLTEYARTRDLSIRDRLALFVKVCDAVHHGHQKGIIHRDLKPGNILVDSNGEPKIIDFGVARATDSDLAVTTLQTEVGQLIGTLQYMSPEQCEADPHDLDTRSDVYALGVLLYELLTDQLPYDLSNAALHEAARVVREEPPKRPSAIDRTLRGDHEAITLKALEKDRRHRYQSAQALMEDLERVLNGETILAARSTRRRRARLWARRRRGPIAMASLVASVAIFAAAPLFWSRNDAAAEVRRLESRADELRRDLVDARQFHANERVAWRRLRAGLGEAARRFASMKTLSEQPPANAAAFRKDPVAMEAAQYLREWVSTRRFEGEVTVSLEYPEMLVRAWDSEQGESDGELRERALMIGTIRDSLAVPWRRELYASIDPNVVEALRDGTDEELFSALGEDAAGFPVAAARLVRMAAACLGSEIGWTRRSLTTAELTDYEGALGASLDELLGAFNMWGTDLRTEDLIQSVDADNELDPPSTAQIVSLVHRSEDEILAQEIRAGLFDDLDFDFDIWWDDPSLWAAVACATLGVLLFVAAMVVRLIL